MATRGDLLRQMQKGKLLHVDGVMTRFKTPFTLRAKVTSEEPFPARHPGGHWSVNVTFQDVNVAGRRRPGMTVPETGEHGVVSVYFFGDGGRYMARGDVDITRRSGTCGKTTEGTSYVCIVGVQRNNAMHIVSRESCIAKSNMAALRRIVKPGGVGARLAQGRQDAAKRTYAPGGAGYEQLRKQTKVGK